MRKTAPRSLKESPELRPSPIAFSHDEKKALLELLGVDCVLPNVPNDEHTRVLAKVARALDGYESLVNAFDHAAQDADPEIAKLESIRSAAQIFLSTLAELTSEQRGLLDPYGSAIDGARGLEDLQSVHPFVGPMTLAEVEYRVAELVDVIDATQPILSKQGQRGAPRKFALRILITRLGDLFERYSVGDGDMARPRRGSVQALSEKEAALEEFIVAALRMKDIGVPKRLDRYFATAAGATDMSKFADLDDAQWADDDGDK